jgi:hypothetical protein
MTQSWIRLASDITLLGFEVHRVISLRIATIALGGRTPSGSTKNDCREMLAAVRASAIRRKPSCVTLDQEYEQISGDSLAKLGFALILRATQPLSVVRRPVFRCRRRLE